MREAGRVRVREERMARISNRTIHLQNKISPYHAIPYSVCCVFSGVIPLVLQPRQAASLLPCRIEPRLLIG